MKRSIPLAILMATLLLCISLSVPNASGLSFKKEFSFKVEGYNYVTFNETHNSLIVLINLTNDSDYDEFIYQRNFYATNNTYLRYPSSTPGSFRILPGTYEAFILNFTIPRDANIQQLVFITTNGKYEYFIDLDPEDDNNDGANDFDILDVVFICILGGAFITVLALIFIITSHKKKRERRFRFLKY